MKVITFTQKSFSKIKPYVLDKSINNTEANFYSFTYKKNKMLLKELHYNHGYTFSGKLQIIELLDYYKQYLPKSFLIPEAIVSVGGDVKGLAIKELKGLTLNIYLNDSTYSIDDKLIALKKIGGILEALKEMRKTSPLENLYINDLHEGNFIINPENKEINVIDLDSARIENSPIFPAKYMTGKSIIKNCPKYIKNSAYDKDYLSNVGYIVPDENSDLFCYTIIILNYLYKDDVTKMSMNEYYTYLNYLQDLKFEKELLDVFSKIVISGQNINPRELIDSLTYKQIFYAQKQEYQNKVKKLVL